MSNLAEALVGVLTAIRDTDPSYQPNTIPEDLVPVYYTSRNTLVYSALYLASMLGYPCGIAVGNSLDWPVVFIELPTGQVSWHLPAYSVRWDGHTTEEKYARIASYAATA
jgi:hypothetical protein